MENLDEWDTFTVKQSIEGAHACDELARSQTSGFVANIASITLELALVTLEWAFSAVGKLVWLGGYSKYISTRTRRTCMGVRHWEGLDSNQYSHSSHLHARSPLWKGLDSNL